MTLAEFHPAIKQGLAIHEALRRLGIEAADVYVMANSHQVAVRQGRCLLVVAKLLAFDGDDFEQQWKGAIGLWNGGASDAEREAVWQEHRPGTEFVLKLACLGIPVNGKQLFPTPPAGEVH